ncbi:MAG: hypothetical protein M1832_001709 [Thelocarpon impressellum]|nr:MAG: hypothetical protein M1832_001709 [Thelocarpon impressellum]
MPERKSSTKRIIDFASSIRRKPSSKEGKEPKSPSETRDGHFNDGLVSPGGEFKAELDGGSDAELPAPIRIKTVPGSSRSVASRDDSGTSAKHHRYEAEGIIENIAGNVEIIRGLHRQSLANFDDIGADEVSRELHYYGRETSALCIQLTEHFANPTLIRRISVGVVEQAKMVIKSYQNAITDYLDSIRLQMEEKYRTVRPDASDLEVAAALKDLSSRNYSISLLRIDDREDIQPIIRAVEKRSRVVSVAEEKLRELKQLHGAITATDGPASPVHDIAGYRQELDAADYVIAPLGDVILVFGSNPRAQFQVSSQALSSVSLLFSYALNPYKPNDRFQRPPPPADMLDELPSAPPAVIYPSMPAIVRMPQDEKNEYGALSTLLYAVHARHDKVPRNIDFREFVAIAAVCHRYRCTAPVEIFVECFWLPQWKHYVCQRGYEDFLFISYVFGLAGIFELTSKMFIAYSRGETLPFEEQHMPEHVWRRLNQERALQFSKVLTRCNLTLSSYLPPTRASFVDGLQSDDQTDAAAFAARHAWQLMRPTKCPHGSHACDAANLGMLMMVLNEVGVPHLFSTYKRGDALVQWQGHNLTDIFAKLCAAPSADQVHDGDCDYATAFRNAMCDIYNGIRGLNVRDVNESFAGRRASGLKGVGGPAADESTRALDVLSNGDAAASRSDLAADGERILPPGSPTYQAYSRRTLPLRLAEEDAVGIHERGRGDGPGDGNVDTDADRRSIASTEVDTQTERCVSPSPTMASAANAAALPPVNLARVATINAVAAQSDILMAPDARESREVDKIYWRQHAHKERITIADKELIISRKHIMRIGEERGLPPLRGEAAQEEVLAPLPSPTTSEASEGPAELAAARSRPVSGEVRPDQLLRGGRSRPVSGELRASDLRTPEPWYNPVG